MKDKASPPNPHTLHPAHEIDEETGKMNASPSKTLDQVTELQAELETLRASHQIELKHCLADQANLQRRLSLQIENARQFGTKALLRDLLPVLDSLENNLTENAECTDQSAWQKGLQATHQLLMQALQQAGVTPIVDPTGQRFDPEFHSAMKMTTDESILENHVVSVLQKGYLLHGKLLRATLVEVSTR